MTIIALRGVLKRFGETEALKRLDLDIRSGEFFTLLGPSGCGKTTLLRMIAGFLHQDEGELRIGDTSASDLPPWKRETGMVFQNYAIFPHLSVFDNVAYGLRQRRVPKAALAERVGRALAQVQLTGYEKRLPEHLSGGQKQRVVLARALVIEPRVLLMDEPLSNLDAKLRVAMRRDIRLLQQDLGITTIYVTHDQEEALAVSDRIMVMEEGLIRQIGAPREIYDEPAHVFVAGFVGACNILHARAEGGSLAVAGARLPAPEGLPEGVPLSVALRPEDLVLAEPGVDRMAGHVRLASFLGPVTRVTIVLAEGAGEVEIDLPRRSGAQGVEPGAPVHFAALPGALRVFDAREGASHGVRLA